MRPDLLRPLLGTLGVVIGFGLYAALGRLPEPWPHLLLGLAFVLLGVTAWVYAQGERWIQGLGVALMLYGLVRAFLLH